MNILLAGGSGFLGNHVAAALDRAGHHVTSLSRGRRMPVAGAANLIADRRDPDAMRRALEGRRFDFTVDLAAYDAIDVEILFRLPRLTLGPYVMISTGQIYLVTTRGRMPFVEEASEAALSPEPPHGTADHREWSYGTGKRRAEGALLALRVSHGVRGVVLRLPVLMGEGDTSLRLWAYLERILDGGSILLPEGGVSPLRFLHAGDVGHAVVEWAEKGLAPSPIYNLAQPDITTLRATIEMIAAAAGRSPRLVDAPMRELEREGLERSFSPYSGPWVSVLDPARASVEWGFTGTAMERYLPTVVRWHLENRPSGSHSGYLDRALEIDLAAHGVPRARV